MRVATASLLMRRPRAEVFTFHADAANLSRVVPFALLRARGETHLAPERVVAIDVGIGPFVSRGAITVREFDPPRCFVDVQRIGPFALWRHSHRFLVAGAFTIVTDTVSFALVRPLRPLEPLAERAVAAFLALKLRRTARVMEAMTVGV